MSKKVCIRIGRSFRLVSSELLIEWLNASLISIINEMGDEHYKLTSVILTDEKDYTDENSRIVWVEAKFKKAKKEKHYVVHIVKSPPTPNVIRETDEKMGEAVKETGYTEVARSVPLLWWDEGIGIVVAKDPYH